MLGKEAALFVPSGTMSNAVAVRTHTQPGDEIVAEEHSHLYVYEGEDLQPCLDVPWHWFQAVTELLIQLIFVNGSANQKEVVVTFLMLP